MKYWCEHCNVKGYSWLFCPWCGIPRPKEEKVALPREFTFVCKDQDHQAFASAINKLINYLKEKEKGDGQ